MSAMTLPLSARCCAGALLAAGLLSFRWEHCSADPTPACLPVGADVEGPVAAAEAVVRGQLLFEIWEGPFGISVGDLDGDGCDDVAVSNRRLHRDSRERANTVKVYAGPRGDVLWGVAGGPGFGCHIAGVDDLDGDGVRDLLIATGDTYEQQPQSIGAYSGASGMCLYELEFSDFAASLAGIGDVDGDGRGDFAYTTQWTHELDRGGAGLAVRSGIDGHLLWSVRREGAEYDSDYAAVVPVGDVDQDGVGDLAFCGPCPDDGGLGSTSCLSVLSGTNGDELWSLPSSTHRKYYESEALSGGGDFDGDGVLDVVLGGLSAGTLVTRVVSGADARTLREVSESDVLYYGWSTAALGDFDGDGVADFAVGAPAFETVQIPAAAFVYSGATGERLHTALGLGDEHDELFPARSWAFGICVSSAGDFNGDGFGDVLIGESRHSDFGAGLPDRMLILAGGPAGDPEASER